MHKQLLDQEYQALCSQLGDAYIKLKKIQNHISNLESRISTLDEAFPYIQNIENKLKQDIEEQVEKRVNQINAKRVFTEASRDGKDSSKA